MRDGARHSGSLSTEGELATGAKGSVEWCRAWLFPLGGKPFSASSQPCVHLLCPQETGAPPHHLWTPLSPYQLQSGQSFSRSGPQTNRIHITWAVLELKILEPHPDLLVRNCGVGPSTLCLDKPSHPQNSDALICQLPLWHVVDRGGRREGGGIEELEGKPLT